jgi:hypothetical protein
MRAHTERRLRASLASVRTLRYTGPVLRIAWVFVLVAGCGGGSHLVGRTYHDDEARYRIGELGTGWTRISVADNDLAFHNASLEAVVEVNASCDPAADIPLTVLTNHLLAGFTQRQTLSEDLMPLDGREALRTHVVASLDGVPREFLIFVMKKNDCVYDLVLIAPQGDAFTRSQTVFESFVGGFTTEVSGT